MKKVALASDHGGYEAKKAVKQTLDALGVAYDDFGTQSADSVDYPDYAAKVAKAVAAGDYDQGILVCGTGIGMVIAANKVHGIRAALAWNEETARLARTHNNANIITVGERTTPIETIQNIVRIFLTTEFEGGRHQRRVEKITQLES